MRTLLISAVLAAAVALSGCGEKSSPSKTPARNHPGHYKNKPTGY